MKKKLEDVLVKYEDPIIIQCANTNSINISKNTVMYSKTKHNPIKNQFLREQVSQKIVKLEYIDMKKKFAHIFTKPLPKEEFEHLRHKLGVISLR